MKNPSEELNAQAARTHPQLPQVPGSSLQEILGEPASGNIPVPRLKPTHPLNRARSVLKIAPLPNAKINTKDKSTVTADGRFSEKAGVFRTGAHYGVDLAAPVGTPVLSPGRGTVNSVQDRGGLGRAVYVDYAEHIRCRFAHLTQNDAVADGDRVEVGDIIGYVGMTGNVPSTAQSHLHYEIVTTDTWERVDPALVHGLTQ